MKLLYICIFLSFRVFAQNANINNETNLNNQLLQNAALSEQYQQQAQQQSGAPLPRPSINPLETTSNTNNNGLNLTDQDKQLSENYVNQAGANKIIKEKCSGDMEAVCAGQAGKHKFAGMDPALIQMASKAYAMFSIQSDGKITMKGDKENADPEKQKEHKESDNCKYIPTVTEGLATFSHQQEVKAMNDSPQNADTAQRDSLLKAAKSHDERAKMAKIQMYGWYGGAACYGVMLATGAKPDLSIAAKIGAGVFLGEFYRNEVKVNEDNADTIRTIASSLPGKGDCNPITQKTCYCAQKENQADAQYEQFCSPQGLHKNPIAKTSYRVACTDNQLKIDPACNCTKTNSCFDQTFDTNKDLQNALGFGTGNSAPLGEIRDLSRGELRGGNLSGASGGPALAIAKRAMSDLTKKLPLNSNPLNPNQNAFYKELMNKGIPAELAYNMAQENVSASAQNSAMAKFQGALGGTAAPEVVAARSNVLDFSGGSGLGISGKKDSGKKDDDFLAKFNPNNRNQSAGGARIMEFAAKAQTQGQILKSDKPIFEIISNRYQMSGRRLLEIDAAR